MPHAKACLRKSFEVFPVHHFHETFLRLLTIDDSKLANFHAGRFEPLPQFGGKVIEELVA